MNKQLTVFASALMFAGLSMAQGLTRADVVSDLQAARNSGELARMHAEVGTEGLSAPARKLSTITASKPVPVTGKTVATAASADVAAPVAADKTRAAVIAELAAAQASGELVAQRVNAELGYTPYPARLPAATVLAGEIRRAN